MILHVANGLYSDMNFGVTSVLDKLIIVALYQYGVGPLYHCVNYLYTEGRKVQVVRKKNQRISFDIEPSWRYIDICARLFSEN